MNERMHVYQCETLNSTFCELNLSWSFSKAILLVDECTIEASAVPLLTIRADASQLTRARGKSYGTLW